MREFNLRIDGMHCGSCIRRVTQVLNQGGGMNVLEVRLGAARIASPTEPAPIDHAIAALAKAGYSAQLEQ